jgi:transposase
LAKAARRTACAHQSNRRGLGGGGENWAVIASLVETGKLCGVDPQAYLVDVLTRIVNGGSHP